MNSNFVLHVLMCSSHVPRMSVKSPTSGQEASRRLCDRNNSIKTSGFGNRRELQAFLEAYHEIMKMKPSGIIAMSGFHVERSSEFEKEDAEKPERLQVSRSARIIAALRINQVNYRRFLKTNKYLHFSRKQFFCN